MHRIRIGLTLTIILSLCMPPLSMAQWRPPNWKDTTGKRAAAKPEGEFKWVMDPNTHCWAKVQVPKEKGEKDDLIKSIMQTIFGNKEATSEVTKSIAGNNDGKSGATQSHGKDWGTDVTGGSVGTYNWQTAPAGGVDMNEAQIRALKASGQPSQ